jgi:hypothetical protein
VIPNARCASFWWNHCGVSTDGYLAAIQATYEDLDRWRERAARNPPEQPEVGSKLAADDEVFKWYPISEAARLSLVAAGEHLRLGRDAIEIGQLYASAHFTACRAALVGAAQAVWVLAPGDAAERRQRGLTVVSAAYTELGKHYRETSSFDLDDQERRQLDEQVGWLEQRKHMLALQRDRTTKLNQTEFIHWSLDYLFPDDARRQDGRTLWRQMSSDAHVLGWSLFQRSTMSVAERRTGLAVGAVGGNLQHIAQPFIAAYRLLKEGWSLFDRLCEAE